jgi:hypothetical protein
MYCINFYIGDRWYIMRGDCEPMIFQQMRYLSGELKLVGVWRVRAYNVFIDFPPY